MRDVFRSTWFSALIAVWYALVAMPVLPMIQFGQGRAAGDASCVTVCACIACGGGDACCCAASAPSGHIVIHPGQKPPSEQEDGCPAWRPVDCTTKAAWMTGLKAPSLTPVPSDVTDPSRPVARIAVVDERAMPADPIGVPEPPPRIAA